MKIRVATYNVHNTDGAQSINGIAKEIKDTSASFVGLQELDVGVKRSKRKNTLGEINKICGYPTAVFSKSIDFGGGEYGIGILCSMPLVSMQKYMLPSVTEQRILVKTVFETEEGYISFFNTHLSYLEKKVREAQFNYISSILEKERKFIMTGDFNISSFEEYASLGSVRLSNSAKEPINTYKPGGCIDNIIVSSNITIEKISLCESDYSDHNMLVADLII